MADVIRCQRLKVGKFAFIGLVLVFLPAAVGGGILAGFSAGVIPWTVATFCFIIAFFFAYPTLRMFHWIETDGRIIQGRRFWTRFMIRRKVAHLIELRATLGQFAEQGRDPALGPIHAYNYQLLFRDRMYVFLSCADMTNAEAFVERITIEPGTHLAMPVMLAGLRLGRYMVHDDAATGRSYVYYGPGHLLISIHIYRGEGGPVEDGIHSPQVFKEFEDALNLAGGGGTEEGGGAEGAGGTENEEKQETLINASKTRRIESRLGEDAAAPQVRCAIFDQEVDDELIESRLYLTAKRDHFIKVRCSMPATYRNTWGPAIARFEAELGRLLSQPMPHAPAQ